MADDSLQVPGRAAAPPAVGTNHHPPGGTAAVVAPAPKPKQPAAPARPKDAVRELAETIVFVVVLVLLLKSFAAEAFVIPTGSMASTLWGYQKAVTCPQCGYLFPVNCSEEAEKGEECKVVGCTCPNCHYDIEFGRDVPSPRCSSGDRVLVAKYLYDSGLVDPKRLDVVVFKYPEEPQKQQVQMNYIKRAVGLPGETIGIHGGKLYVLPADQSPRYDDSAAKPESLWQKEFMHVNDAMPLLTKPESPFQIVRKPPDKVLALRRIVYDNDHPAKDLVGRLPARWADEDSNGTWKTDGTTFQHGESGKKIDWLRYRNILRTLGRPQLVTDFLAYNSKRPLNPQFCSGPAAARNWVGDLMIEGDVTVESPKGELVLELTKGVDRFRARFDLSKDDAPCTLTRTSDGAEVKLNTQPTTLRNSGAHTLRFANVDDRLLVWVDANLPFGKTGIEYKPPRQPGPTEADLRPAGVGVAGGAAVKLDHLRLWRDTYYTVTPGGDPRCGDFARAVQPANQSEREQRDWERAYQALLGDEGWADKDMWEPLRHLPAETLYVQPGHYLCMGDNSPESSDGRSWGLVPSRLLLGRALFVYFPFYNPLPEPFLPSPVNRIGPIH